MDDAPRFPKELWTDLTHVERVDVASDEVYMARAPGGDVVYVRPDDGSADELARLRSLGLPVPIVLRRDGGWLLLAALGGIAMSDPHWIDRPEATVRIVVTALNAMHHRGVTHGDACLPNLLADPRTEQLTGIVDWGAVDRHDREYDLAAVVWSLRRNGHPDDTANRVLETYGAPASGARELERLRVLWEAPAPRTHP